MSAFQLVYLYATCLFIVEQSLNRSIQMLNFQRSGNVDVALGLAYGNAVQRVKKSS
jgi:hypothetical protein